MLLNYKPLAISYWPSNILITISKADSQELKAKSIQNENSIYSKRIQNRSWKV